MGVISSVAAGAAVYQVIRQQMKKQSTSGSSSGAKGLSFGGQLRVAQHIPGRLRLYSPHLSQKDKGQILQVQLSRIDGIIKVSTEALTGSVLILYRSEKIEGTMLVGAIARLLGINDESDVVRPSKVMKEVRLASRSINYALLDSTKGMMDLRTLVAIAFFGLGIKAYLQNGTLGTPSALTLFYWAYNSFGLNGEVCK